MKWNFNNTQVLYSINPFRPKLFFKIISDTADVNMNSGS